MCEFVTNLPFEWNVWCWNENGWCCLCKRCMYTALMCFNLNHQIDIHGKYWSFNVFLVCLQPASVGQTNWLALPPLKLSLFCDYLDGDVLAPKKITSNVNSHTPNDIFTLRLFPIHLHFLYQIEHVTFMNW